MPNTLWHLRSGTWQRPGRSPIAPPGGGGGGSLVQRLDLPFDMPTRDLLAASPYKVLPHYVTPFPLSVSNKAYGQDYWDTVWQPPGVVEGTGSNATDHRVYGGLTRDRPMRGRAISPNTQQVQVGATGSSVTTARYTIDDRITEVNDAIDAGFDGFLSNMQANGVPNATTGVPSNAYRQWRELLVAIGEVADPTFRYYIQPDGSGSFTADYKQMAKELAELAAKPQVYKQPSGNLLVAPYGPEFAPSNAKNDPNFWSNLRTYYTATYGGTIDLWNVFSAAWPTNGGRTASGLDAPTMNAYSYGHSRWGLRNPVDSNQTNTGARGAAAYCWSTFGKPYMTPVAPTDERPRGRTFNECRNSEQWRVAWLAAIEQQAQGHAPWIVLPTWNDYAENSHFMPSRNHGYCLLDIASYYLVKFKTGSYPTIQRPGIYLSHRVQPLSGVTYTADASFYTTRMVVSGGTPAVDQIEALAFLPSAATVSITVNGTVVKSQACSPGVTSVVAPLGLGTIAAKAVDSAGKTVASITSPWTVSTTQVVQDCNYRYSSSLRGATTP